MARTLPLEGTPSVHFPGSLRVQAQAVTRWAMEILVLVMVCLSPWAFGAVEPKHEYLLDTGVALVAGLWAVRILLEGQLTLQKCPVTLGLFGLFVLGLWQLWPLPQPVLAQVSPGTARLYGQLLPAQAEELPSAESRLAVTPPPGSTVSLYPAATRQDLIRLLAVFLLFAAVRNNLATPGALHRLSVVAFANGVLLALFALFQFFQSPDHMVIYGRFRTDGQVFGPFICRNHFPFYLNICIGLGLGLLLRPGDAARSRGGNPLTNLLNDPRRLWVSLGLALMLSSVAVSLSRGGMVALLGGVVLGLVVQLARFPRVSRLLPLLLTVLLGFGLVFWFGSAFIEARLATLWKGQALESRMPVWKSCLPLVTEFPWLGSGYGTFQYVELLHRQTGPEPDVIFTHAHNDYLEALIEGGVVRFLLSLLLIGLVYRQAFRAIRRFAQTPAAGWVLGGLVGFTTVVLHSFVDFGIHIPAIAVLITVVSAYLCGLGTQDVARSPDRATTEEPDSAAYSFRLFGLAPLAGALVLGVAAGGLYFEGRRTNRVQQYRLAAFPREAIDRDQQIAYLEDAAHLAPDYARLQFELSQVCFAGYEQIRQREEATRPAAVVPLVLAPLGTSPSPLAMLTALRAAPAAREAFLRREEGELAHRYLEPGLRHCLAARDLCPLMSQPQVSLATYADRLRKADPPRAYLDRAKQLASTDPQLWFQSGFQELIAGRHDQAWQDWRRTLELSDEYLPRILPLAARQLPPADLATKLLPEKPELLIAAAQQLYPEPGAAAQRQPFLEQALRALEKRTPPLKADDLHLKGSLLQALGRLPEAVTAYQAALLQQPRHWEWRLELARVLVRAGQLKEARRELELILAQQPNQAEARSLLTAVERKLAERL